MTSSGSEEEKNRGFVVDHQHHQYGTFQGVANYPPPAPSYSPPHPPHHHHHQQQQPAIGFPQPVPPHGVHGPSVPPPQYYAQGYQTQTVQGYAVAEGRPVREHRLPCCGLGVGWFLFIIGFFLGAIPWYVGLLVLLCGRIDYREKPGYVACTIAAAIATVVIILGATKGADDW